MNKIENQTFPFERDLYAKRDLILNNCRFEGEEDGESALKECKNIELNDCFMDLRYPLWHDDKVVLNNIVQTENARASLWYSKNIEINKSTLNGIKALRECQNIKINNTKAVSPEFGWKNDNLTINDSEIESQYIFFMTKNFKAYNSRFIGKYGFQYMENVVIENCILDTKDAFWHGKHITVKDSLVKGEYLAWYSEDLTFINCKIIGTQPLCYCKNLKLINCTMEGADLAFEYSDVDADINGEIISVKNPRSGLIRADKIGEIINENSVYPVEAKIIIKNKN